MFRVLVALLAAVIITPAQAQQAAPALSPVQLAYFKAESKKANDAFVKEVARITLATDAQVRRALPDEKRITDRVARLISALEKDLRRALSDEQKAAIQTAEEDRRKALATAQEAAARR